MIMIKTSTTQLTAKPISMKLFKTMTYLLGSDVGLFPSRYISQFQDACEWVTNGRRPG